MNSAIVQACGWVGMALIIAAYFLNSRKTLDSQSKTYQLMNVFGAIGAGINCFYQRAWPVLALQIIWGVIAIMTLLKKQKA